MTNREMLAALRKSGRLETVSIGDNPPRVVPNIYCECDGVNGPRSNCPMCEGTGISKL
jgi:hypothetical protein